MNSAVRIAAAFDEHSFGTTGSDSAPVDQQSIVNDGIDMFSRHILAAVAFPVPLFPVKEYISIVKLSLLKLSLQNYQNRCYNQPINIVKEVQSWLYVISRSASVVGLCRWMPSRSNQRRFPIRYRCGCMHRLWCCADTCPVGCTCRSLVLQDILSCMICY